MACYYTYEQNGVEKHQTEEMFDAFLIDKIKSLETENLDKDLIDYINSGVLFSLSPFETTVNKVDKIRSEIKQVLTKESQTFLIEGEDPDIEEKLHDVKGYLGVTSLITSYGNPKKNIDEPIVTPFNEQDWAIDFKKRLLAKGIDEATAENVINATKESWTHLVAIGDYVHAVYEATMKNVSIPEVSSIVKLQNGDRIISMIESQKDKIIQQAVQFKQQLIQRYGHGDPSKVKFYPELSLASKKLDKDLAELLAQREDPVHSIAGTIDLLVIDENGNAHIFDYKTSRKRFTPNSWDITLNSLISAEEWSSAKKRSVQNQMAAYNALLEQYGIRGADCQIVPIWLNLKYVDSNKSVISDILDIEQNDTEFVPQTSNGLIYQNMKMLIPSIIETTAGNTTDLLEKQQKLFNIDGISSLQVKQFEANIEYYKKYVKNVSSEDPNYGKNKFYFIKYETTGRREYCKDEEDLNKKLEIYVNQVKEKKSVELFALANTIRGALTSSISIDDFANNYNISNRNFLKTQFGRYINEGWELVSDDNLIGSGLFIFQYNGRSEIVVITNNPIHDKINLGHGSTILGGSIEDQFVNTKEILPASYGAMEAMKALLYVADNPEYFTNNKITQIVTLNPWRSQRTYVSNSQWIENYNRLIETKKDDVFNPVRSSLFWDDVTSMLSIVDSNLRAAERPSELAGFSLNGKIAADNTVLEFTEEYIQKAIEKLRNDYTYLLNTEDQFAGDQNIWMAYSYLHQALLNLKGIHVYNELEAGQWMSSGIKAGLMVSSSGYSGSTNFRVFDDVMQQFALEVRLAVEKQGRPIISTLTEFYKSKGQVKIIGGEANYFQEWFRRTSDGKLDPGFLLKDPNDADFNGNEASKKALDTWLKTMAELRYRPLAKTDQDFENLVAQAKENLEYYQVPLTEAAFSRQAKGLGFFKAAKNKLDEAKELTNDVFAGKSSEKEQWYKTNKYELYNKFNKSTAERERLIEEKGIGFFETNLEDVMNQALVAYNKSRLSRKYIPILDGMRVALRCSASYGGAQMKETLNAFDKLVKSKFYGESIIDETLQPYARWVQAIKAGLSKLALGFNFRSFFRELFQGTWMGLSRSGVSLMPGINIDTYTNGALHVVTKAYKNFSNVSLLQQLNSQYGMANYSMGQIARQRRMNWYGIKNFRSDTMFLTSSAPDFQHRMSILVAKMMGDGCWEAHSLDENGFVKYDFNKDSRFAIYLSGDTSNKEYLDQKSNYIARIEELNKAGIKKDDGSSYKIGDALPMAYLPREIQAIKNFADLLYGHYDDESKSLINDMFLGSMFMQYKTYITSRVEQWTMTPGIYNTELLQHATDPITGEKLYKIHTDAVDEDGLPIIEIKPKSKIDNFEQLQNENKIEACMEWKGIPMEGMARSYVKFAKDIAHWNWLDIKEKWNNPVERDNILIGLHDCLLMSLMMMLITALFGLAFEGEWTTDRNKISRAMRDNGWGASFTYNVAYGSFNDFPFWQSLNSMFGDFNPSMVTSIKRIVENSGAVVLGKKSLFQAVTNTVGAAGDLKGLANRLHDEIS